MASRYDDLATLADVMLDAELARLRARSDAVAALRARIEALDRARLKALNHPPDTLGEARQLSLWIDWQSRKRASLQAEISAAAAQYEAQRKRAQLAFGRSDAFSRLAESDVEDRAMIARRRSFD